MGRRKRESKRGNHRAIRMNQLKNKQTCTDKNQLTNPRPEPESYTTYLATLLLQQQQNHPPRRQGLRLGRGDDTTIPPPLPPFTTSSSSSSSSLRILDLCTGTGCIALLLYSLLRRTVPHLSIHGVDISPHAVALAQENMRHNNLPSHHHRRYHHHLDFTQGDIYSDAWLESFLSSSPSLPPSPPPTTEAKEGVLPINSSKPPPPTTTTSAAAAAIKAVSWDILICNPPYISHWGFVRETERSVRHFEPKLAQVPMVTYPGPHKPQDAFYARLLDVGARLRPRIMLFEVGDLEQAVRVARMALRHAGLRRQDHSLAREEGGEWRRGKEEQCERRKHHISVEIWRDWPDATPGDNERTSVKLSDPHDAGDEIEVRVRGSGHGRSVLIQCQGF